MRLSRLKLVMLVTGVTLLSVPSVPSAPAAVEVGHSGWSWGSPLPQGETIKALEFQGSYGYAAGTFGTALSTSDGGASWNGLATGTTQDLDRVAVIDADSVVFAGACTVRRSDDGGATFKRLPWTASDDRCASPIVALAFPNDQRGYLALDDGTVLQTNDGGVSWSRRTQIPTADAAGGKATGIALTTPDVGVAVTSAGLIYRTTDDAGSWTLVAQASLGLRGVYFQSATIGYAVGDGGAVLKTIDGGLTWAPKGSAAPGRLTSIRCADAITCLATTEAGDRLVRTTDGGDHFSSVTPSTDKVLAAGFSSATRAVAAGASGTTVVSGDAGATWSAVGGKLAGTFTRVRTTSSMLALAAGREGTLARTLDGGRTWTTIGVSTSEDLYDVSFVSRDVGFTLDNAGTVLGTANGGTSWQILNTGTSSRPQAILALDPEVVLLIGPRGILRSKNGGASFGRVSGRRVAGTRLVDVDRGGGSIFAYGSKNIVVSTNKGKSWKKVRLPKRTLISSVDFVSSRSGFALGQDGRVFKTRDRGRHWNDLAGIGTDDAIGLAFDSAAKGYLVLSRFGDDQSGFVLATSDAGRTWRPQLVTSASVFANGLATSGGTDFLLADGNFFFYTDSGGDQGERSSVKIATSKRKVRRKTTVRVTGRIRGAAGGSRVLVERRQVGESGWDYQSARIASNGTFTTTWKITKTSTFVAQWVGDDDQAGDGSASLTIRARRR